MSNFAIRVENLGKRYRIGGPQERYRTFRDTLVQAARVPTGMVRLVLRHSDMRERQDTFWALKGVSLEVQHGEVLGIIGCNGAGKSTLLKILSRITVPTEGRVRMRGRISSLLEVGTGFHQELTGRENIYLNGAILGMHRAEINAKFDEIVHFSGVEKFIDTPVKRYSSGMQVRLAFSVAAHLEPEILLVDEVLAVGDAEFQKRCLVKMGDVVRQGRTVLFVSHNMEAIRRLCPRVVLIVNGSIEVDATSDETIGAYLAPREEEGAGVRVYDDTASPGDDYVRLCSVRVVNHAGKVTTNFKMDESVSFEIEFEVFRILPDFHLYVRVFTRDSIIAFGSGDWDTDGQVVPPQLPGRYVGRCTIPANLLNQGAYHLTVQGMVPNVRYVFAEDNVLQWEVNEMGGPGGTASNHRPGVFRPRLQWAIAPVTVSRMTLVSSPTDLQEM